MNDTKSKSLTETFINIGLGLIVSIISNFVILPLYGFKGSPEIFFEISFWFTLVSLVRAYFIRRLFNRLPANFDLGKVYNKLNSCILHGKKKSN